MLILRCSGSLWWQGYPETVTPSVSSPMPPTATNAWTFTEFQRSNLSSLFLLLKTMSTLTSAAVKEVRRLRKSQVRGDCNLWVRMFLSSKGALQFNDTVIEADCNSWFEGFSVPRVLCNLMIRLLNRGSWMHVFIHMQFNDTVKKSRIASWPFNGQVIESRMASKRCNDTVIESRMAS